MFKLTSIDHDADHGLSVTDGAAPQQQVAAVETHSNATGVLSVEHTHTHTHDEEV